MLIVATLAQPQTSKLSKSPKPFICDTLPSPRRLRLSFSNRLHHSDHAKVDPHHPLTHPLLISNCPHVRALQRQERSRVFTRDTLQQSNHWELLVRCTFSICDSLFVYQTSGSPPFRIARAPTHRPSIGTRRNFPSTINSRHPRPGHDVRQSFGSRVVD